MKEQIGRGWTALLERALARMDADKVKSEGEGKSKGLNRPVSEPARV